MARRIRGRGSGIGGADGSIFTFGEAHFWGSAVSMKLGARANRDRLPLHDEPRPARCSRRCALRTLETAHTMTEREVAFVIAAKRDFMSES